MTAEKITFEFRKDAESHVEIIELQSDGSSFVWDVRFPSQADADAAVKTYKRRLECRKGWGLDRRDIAA